MFGIVRFSMYQEIGEDVFCEEEASKSVGLHFDFALDFFETTKETSSYNI